MNVAFFAPEGHPEEWEDQYEMEAVPRQGDLVQVRGELFVVESVEWDVGTQTERGTTIPPRAYVYLAARTTNSDENRGSE